VGFENLMQKAEQIRAKAHERAWLDVPPDRDPEGTPSIERPREVARIQARAVGIPGTFQPFTKMPNPAGFDGAIGQLEQAMRRLGTGQDTSDPIARGGPVSTANPVLEAIDDVKDDVEEWSGKAAQEFRTNYLRPLPAVIHNQFLLVSALKSVLEAEQAMWKAARDDVMSIADNTYNRMDNLHGYGSNEAVVIFTVTASIAGLVASAGGGGLAIVLALIGGSASAIADIVGLEAPTPTQITGTKVTEVIASMEGAVELLTLKIIETEHKLARAVIAINRQINQAQLSSDPNKQVFCTRRPALANASRGTIRRDMGYSD